MNLYIIHCGFYDEEISEGIYEFHVNFPVVAESVETAKLQIRKNQMFTKKKMHIDGIRELKTVGSYQVQLSPTVEKENIISYQHRDL
jgi:hypothetical protein